MQRREEPLADVNSIRFKAVYPIDNYPKDERSVMILFGKAILSNRKLQKQKLAQELQELKARFQNVK